MEQQNKSADETDLSLKLLVVLTRAAQSVRKGIEKDVRRYGLNVAEFGVLELLYHKGDQPIQKIRGKILMASSSTTYIIDQLEKKQLIRRIPCPTDHRVTFASLTDEGTDMMNQIFPKHREAVRTLLGGVAGSEKKILIELLKKLGLYAASQIKK